MPTIDSTNIVGFYVLMIFSIAGIIFYTVARFSKKFELQNWMRLIGGFPLLALCGYMRWWKYLIALLILMGISMMNIRGILTGKWFLADYFKSKKKKNDKPKK